MKFEWDPDKARRNLATHGIDFEDAKRAVLDPFRLEIIDASFGEILFVVTVFRDEDRCRVISARPATRAESQRYFTHDQA